MAPHMDRRAFVESAAALVGGGFLCGLGACASLAVVPVEPRDGRVRIILREHPALGVPGGHIRIRPVGHPNHLLVFAEGGGEHRVLSPVCTHQLCIVNVEGARLVCPCHGSQYDRVGNVLAGPAERPLPRYPVELTAAGELIIGLEPQAGA